MPSRREREAAARREEKLKRGKPTISKWQRKRRPTPPETKLAEQLAAAGLVSTPLR